MQADSQGSCPNSAEERLVQITGNPTGSFRDAPVRISFHVKTGAATATGTILMSVYNAAKTDLLLAEDQKEPAYVSVSGTTPVQVRLGNAPDALLGLAFALCGGIALGLTARYLLTGKVGKDNEPAVHAILSAFVLALIAEFIGVMMTAYGNSKLVLFDLDIDPRQLFPAFILAMLVSGGSAVVAWAKGLFGKTS